ncbi:hypothetical protein CJD36_020020 [Flavipsychrobacter stenotrophus]|uniref:Uncharacterized protein n=1 Tax=Flavipsychrobacter stenotrophus TaxID=2077091 RepID=A0A2S7SSE4_9BACT|nr:hypothetical protein [Flavipsychrobacter stenotrophus]PQJ09527.1 hypothetical protein CJD36_020020 [Flavipsychrobacter stenotrophus]
MRQKIDINALSGSDKEKASALLREIAVLRRLKKDAAPEQQEELQQEIWELVAHVNNVINGGKEIIKTINNN